MSTSRKWGSAHPQNRHIFCFAGGGTARGSGRRCRQLTLLFPSGLSCGMGSAHNHTFCPLVVAVISQGHLRNPLRRQRVGNIKKIGCGHGGRGRQNWHPRGMPRKRAPTKTQQGGKKYGRHYYPLHASPTPPQTTTSRVSKKIRIKRGSRFQPIDRRTRPISGGRSNQREPPVLPGSPSPRASADILFLPTSRAPEEQRQSRRNHCGGKLGGKWGIGGIGRYIRPSGACSASPLDQTCRRATGTSWISSLLLRGMVPH